MNTIKSRLNYFGNHFKFRYQTLRIKMTHSMDRWRGKVAVVTGASAGIGAALVERLVKEGVQVVGLARRVERVEEIAKKLSKKKGKLHALKVDITKDDDIIKAFDWITTNLGAVHILINNAGIMQLTTLIDGDADKWRKTFDTNVLGLCVATREAVKIMKNKGIEGHIVHINSEAGHKVPQVPKINVYPASKFAVTALTESLRQEIRASELKIKVSSVSPGAVTTEFTANLDIPKKVRKMMSTLPFLKSEDIVESVIHILSTPPGVEIHELTILPQGLNTKLEKKAPSV